jgi:hypothetical protein
MRWNKMKFNWTTLKVVLTFVVIVGVVFWAGNLVRSRSYNGGDLKFGVSSGLISITNPSDQAIPVQLIGSGSRTFRVSSTIDDVSGSSTREGSGSSRTHLFEFELPSGTSELIVSGGTDINLVASTDVNLQATVNPMSNDSRRNTLIATAVAVLGLLFYASNVVNHQWMNIFPGKNPLVQDTQPASVSAKSGQGAVAQSYGDNRTNKTND